MALGVRAFFLALFLFSRPVFAFDLGAMDWDSLGDAFVNENHTFKAHWQSNQKWKESLCSGNFSYDVDLNALIDRMKAYPEHPDSLLIDVLFSEIDSNLLGSYRSTKTLCIPFAGGLHVRLGNVRVLVRANTVIVGSDAKIKVTILDTEFGTIQFGNSVPQELERFVAKVLNSAFRHVWSSKLGTWINNKVSEELNQHRNE